MLSVLRHRTYRHLFLAQVVALVGTGLLTVALGLFAYDLAGADGARVLGIAMAIKMIAYVFISPLMQALVAARNRRSVLIGADVVRAAIALSLPWVDQVWQIYILIFVLQSASATFTPTFQSVIPDVLPGEREYTRALSLARMAYNLESIASPALAALALLFVSSNDLFFGTAAGFVASAALVVTVTLPARHAAQPAPFAKRVTAGTVLYVRAPELRSLLGMHLAVAAATAMIIVNTPVTVGIELSLRESAVPLLLGASGAGEMLTALLLPGLLDKIRDRRVMLAGALSLAPLLLLLWVALASASGVAKVALVALLWFAMGVAISAVLTASGRVVRRNSDESNRSAVFAADFSLSHACFFATYLVAGFAASAWGVGIAALVLAVLATSGAVWATAAPGRKPGGAEVR